jgi:hypothetical protein
VEDHGAGGAAPRGRGGRRRLRARARRDRAGRAALAAGRLTASQHLFNLMHYGYDGVVASLALFLFGATALVTWSGMHVGRLGTNRLA